MNRRTMWTNTWCTNMFIYQNWCVQMKHCRFVRSLALFTPKKKQRVVKGRLLQTMVDDNDDSSNFRTLVMGFKPTSDHRCPKVSQTSQQPWLLLGFHASRERSRHWVVIGIFFEWHPGSSIPKHPHLFSVGRTLWFPHSATALAIWRVS